MKKNKTREIKVRLTDEELLELNRLVARSGLSREEYVRSLIKKIIPSDMPSVELVETIKQLRMIGNNLNQIAVIAHKTHSIDIMKYKKNIDDLQDMIQYILKVINEPRILEEGN